MPRWFVRQVVRHAYLMATWISNVLRRNFDLKFDIFAQELYTALEWKQRELKKRIDFTYWPSLSLKIISFETDWLIGHVLSNTRTFCLFIILWATLKNSFFCWIWINSKLFELTEKKRMPISELNGVSWELII